LEAEDRHLAICATCKADLRHFEPGPANADAAAFQSVADETLALTGGRYGGECLSQTEWFSLARWFIGLLRLAARRGSGTLVDLVRSLDVSPETLSAPATGLALELLPVCERTALLGGVWRLLVPGPVAFHASAASMSIVSLHQVSKSLPSCLDSIAHEMSQEAIRQNGIHQNTEVRPRSRRAVMRMWARLRRKAWMYSAC
jgi:hypothetical protein